MTLPIDYPKLYNSLIMIRLTKHFLYKTPFLLKKIKHFFHKNTNRFPTYSYQTSQSGTFSIFIGTTSGANKTMFKTIVAKFTGIVLVLSAVRTDRYTSLIYYTRSIFKEKLVLFSYIKTTMFGFISE